MVVSTNVSMVWKHYFDFIVSLKNFVATEFDMVINQYIDIMRSKILLGTINLEQIYVGYGGYINYRSNILFNIIVSIQLFIEAHNRQKCVHMQCIALYLIFSCSL